MKVLLPASVVCDTSALRQKTAKVGLLGRTLAIFRVKEVYLYDDHEPRLRDPEAEMNLIKVLLEYMETPQYLRKIMFGKREELRFAGLLPPLRTPHHPVVGERSSRGQIREGAVIFSKKGQSIVELGLAKRGILNEEGKPGTRITVRIVRDSGDHLIVERVRGEEIKEYWGYRVFTAGSLKDAVKMAKPAFIVGTSKYGRSVAEVADQLRSAGSSLAVAFGGPYAGLFEICSREGLRAEEMFDVIVNTIPDQGTETVRTEEALLASLAVLNILTRFRPP